MAMVTHINKVCKAASFHLYNLRRIRKYLINDTTKTQVQAMIMERIDNCISLLCGIPAVYIGKLQRIQNSAARLICGLPRFSQISTTLFSLHWLPVPYRVDFKVLLLACKAVYGLAPPYICDRVKRKAPSRYTLRPDDALMLQQPSGKSRKTLGDRAFTVSAPALWNKLPERRSPVFCKV